MTDLISAVGAWHRAIFGEHDPLDHVRGIAQKAQEEARELEEDPGERELADLFTTAFAAADRLRLDGEGVRRIVLAKLAILEVRGVGQLERDRVRGIVQAADRAAMLQRHGIVNPEIRVEGEGL